MRWLFPTLLADFERSEVLALAVFLFAGFVIEAILLALVSWWQQRRWRTDLAEQRQQLRAEREFVSLAAHQLRTPLSALKWSLDMLRKGEVGALTAEQMPFIEKIETTNNHLITLVNDLLNVSRLEEQRMVFTAESFDAVQKTRDVLDMARKSYADKKLSLTADMPARPVTLTTDPGKIEMALLNIIDNAFKYTPAGGAITITLAATPRAVTWTITDSGIGIPRPQQRRLFEKFFRADNAIKSQIAGTGLGLYLARKIIEHEHGTLTIASAESKGTTVTITLPLASTHS